MRSAVVGDINPSLKGKNSLLPNVHAIFSKYILKQDISSQLKHYIKNNYTKLA